MVIITSQVGASGTFLAYILVVSLAELSHIIVNVATILRIMALESDRIRTS